MTYAIDKYMNAQVIYWKKQKEQLNEAEKVNRHPFVTISREYGCGGFMVAAKIVEIFNDELKPDPQWAAYDKKILDRLMKDTGLSAHLVETLTEKARSKMTNIIQTTFSSFPPQVAIHKKLTEMIALLALHGNVVIVGRGSNMITKNFINGFHVRLVAPVSRRVEKISKEMNISKNEALKLINEKTKQRDEYMKEFLRFDLTDPHNYDLTINDGEFTVEQAAGLIIEGMRIKGILVK
ncbi:MAG TPA: cytidylate kinase-like family protein [Spirochaetota bacterium]|nr:cytidylate kinase-like family protein [Spirochaetota bacterium]